MTQNEGSGKETGQLWAAKEGKRMTIKETKTKQRNRSSSVSRIRDDEVELLRVCEVADTGVSHIGGLVRRHHIIPTAHFFPQLQQTPCSLPSAILFLRKSVAKSPRSFAKSAANLPQNALLQAQHHDDATTQSREMDGSIASKKAGFVCPTSVWPLARTMALSLLTRRGRIIDCSKRAALSLFTHNSCVARCLHTPGVSLFTHSGLNTNCSNTPGVSPYTHTGLNTHRSHRPYHLSHTMALTIISSHTPASTLTVHTQRPCHSLFTHEFYFLYFSLVLSGHQISFPFSKL